MRIALIFNPFKYKVHEENIRIVQKYFGLFPPLSLAWVAAIAERSGHEAIIIDARTMDLSKEETLGILRRFKPDIIGFMMTTYMFPDTLDWIRYFKSCLNVHIMVGGYNLRVYPHESVSYPEIDFGIVEHAYHTLPALLRELERCDPDFDRVPGLAYKKDGKIIITPHPQKIVFDDFPNPARHLLFNELYAEFPTEKKNFTVMVTSLGCPFGCLFCEAGRTAYNPRSPERVVEEIEECYFKYGIREIDIFDYEFTGIRERTLRICKLIQEKNLYIKWACRSRVDTVDEELLEEMKESGCSRIYFGLESGNQDILSAVNKGIELKRIKETLNTCNRLKIRSLGFFLIGAPGETKETVKMTIKFAKKLNLDYVQFSKCLAKPLTPLWKQMVGATNKDYWHDWILGKETDRDLPRPWTQLTNKEVDSLARWAYISYHARLSSIMRHILRIKSFSELKRKLFAFMDMLFNQEEYAKQDMRFKAFNENRRKDIERCKKELFERVNGSGSARLTLSIITPTYNESENIAELAKRIVESLSCIRYEHIIIDDASPDGTARVAQELSRIYPIRVVNRGRKMDPTSAIMEGCKVSLGDFVCVIDADLSHPPELIPVLMKNLESSGVEIALASRYMQGGRIRNWPISRRIISHIGTLLARPLTSVSDPLSGFFLVKRGTINKVGQLWRGYKILLEILIKIEDVRAIEVPFVFKDRATGKSKLTFGACLNFVICLLRLYWKKIEKWFQ
jgi:radical SAM superfamily enzyme YgiQ (UPF0313 family)